MLANDEKILEGDHRVVPRGHIDGAAFAEVVTSLRMFQDTLAGARLTDEDVRPVVDALRSATTQLQARMVPDGEQDFSNRFDVACRGQSMTPWYDVLLMTRAELIAEVEFGRWFTGRVSAHGGAIPLLFDDLFGMLAGSDGRPPARTAYLNVEYKLPTPIERRLRFEGTVVSEEGRKRLLRGAIYDGDALCAAAESLFVAVKGGAW